MKPSRLRDQVRAMMIAVAWVSTVLAGIVLRIRTRYRSIRVVNRSGQSIARRERAPDPGESRFVTGAWPGTRLRCRLFYSLPRNTQSP